MCVHRSSPSRRCTASRPRAADSRSIDGGSRVEPGVAPIHVTIVIGVRSVRVDPRRPGRHDHAVGRREPAHLRDLVAMRKEDLARVRENPGLVPSVVRGRACVPARRCAASSPDRHASARPPHVRRCRALHRPSATRCRSSAARCAGAAAARSRRARLRPSRGAGGFASRAASRSRECCQWNGPSDGPATGCRSSPCCGSRCCGTDREAADPSCRSPSRDRRGAGGPPSDSVIDRASACAWPPFM